MASRDQSRVDPLARALVFDQRQWLEGAKASERLCWARAQNQWSAGERAWALRGLSFDDPRDRAWGLGPLMALGERGARAQALAQARVELWRAGRGDARGPWDEAFEREALAAFEVGFKAWGGPERSVAIEAGVKSAVEALGQGQDAAAWARRAKLAAMARSAQGSALTELARKALGPIEREIVAEVFGKDLRV